MPSRFKIFKRPVKKARYLFDIAKFCRRITPIWNINYLTVFLRSVRLCDEGRFLPDEAFRLGLFRPNLSTDELSKYISRKKLTKIQESLNPVQWAPLLKDKSIFYRYCMTLDVPIPKLYAVFFKGVAGWSYSGSVLSNRNEWERFIDSQLPSEFVIKPVRSAYGRGVNIFSKTKDEFVDASARLYKAVDIYDTMLSSAEEDGILIQQRLKNHAELVRLSNTEFLQTVRIITFVDSDYKSNILHAHFKPIVGRHVVDTFLDGLTGNIEAPVSLADGILKLANQITSSGEGIKTIYKHPQTGVSFEGFKLPLWTEACKLVKETSLKFLPVRTIGWDVALTPNGPCIVEGNIWWDPPNQHRIMDVLKYDVSLSKGAAPQVKISR